MASGSENRRRQKPLKARFTDEEAALIEEQAARAGISVAALIRFALLNEAPPRASRRPTIDHETAARLLAAIGPLKAALTQAASAPAGEPAAREIEAACRDIADMRVALFEALGRQP